MFPVLLPIVLSQAEIASLKQQLLGLSAVQVLFLRSRASLWSVVVYSS